MTDLDVRWLFLRDLGRSDAGDAVAIALVSPDRRALARPWANVLDADVLPLEFRSGEVLHAPRFGYVVMFEPEPRFTKESAEAQWPELPAQVAAAAKRKRARPTV